MGILLAGIESTPLLGGAARGRVGGRSRNWPGVEVELSGFGRLLMFLGGVVFLVGAGIFLAGRLHFRIGPLLPGDIYVTRGNVTFFFPVVTSILLSILLTLLLNLLLLRRR